MRKKKKDTGGYVYAIFFNDDLAYVGYTVSINTRFHTHEVYQALKMFGETKIESVYFNRSWDAYATEQELIRSLQPPLNIASNANHTTTKYVFFLLKHLISVDAVMLLVKKICPIYCGITKKVQRFINCKY